MWHGCYQPVALLRSYGRPGCCNSGLQLFCIVRSHVSRQRPIDCLWGSGQASWLANQAQSSHGHWARFWYFWQCGQVPCPAGKWSQHLHKACLLKEAWSALKCPGRRLCSHWNSSILNCVTLTSSSWLWDLGFQMRCKICSHQKKGHWTTEQPTEQLFFSLAQVRRFWHCLMFRSGLTRNTTFDPSECGGSWCTNPSLTPLLVKLPHTFEWPFHVHPLQAMVIPAGYAPFSSFSFSFESTFLSYFLNICIVIRHPVLIWLAFYRPIMWINVLLPGWRYKC